MNIIKSLKRGKQPSASSSSFLAMTRNDLIVMAIWVLGLIPAFVVSVFKKDPLYASFITVLIQFLASFGSITFFGVVCQLFCYRYVESSEVHDMMMDGLFYGFHVGMTIWIFYAFYHIIFGTANIGGDISALIAFFGLTCIISCAVGIVCGFVAGHWKEAQRNR